MATDDHETAAVLYHSDVASVICGDSRLVLSTLATESVDCVVTDPPYGVAWRSNTRGERFDAIDGDDDEASARSLLAEVAGDLIRVTRRTRHLYTFGLPISHPLLTVKAELVWDKGRIGSGDLACPWGPSHELIYFQVRAADKTNAARGSGSLAARLRRGSVIRVKRLSATQVRDHPTEKPVALMQQLVESSTMPGELVMDPFAGVGSTGVAALLSGRRCLLIEIDPRYAKLAAERIAETESLVKQQAQL